MRPIRVTATNFGSYADLDYTFQDGATAVVGSNGSGKSTLIGAVDIALFGPRSRSLEPLVREGTDTMTLTLEFEHAGEAYRVRRGWKSGRSTLDFERLIHTASTAGVIEGTNLPLPAQRWNPMTQGNAADTQSLIETTIGMSRDTFRCSGYLAQRDSASFTGAQPKDRKRILGDALGLDQWAADADRVAGDRRAAEKELGYVEARIAPLAERAAAADSLATERGQLVDQIEREQGQEGDLREEAEYHAGRAADLEDAERNRTVAAAKVSEARTYHAAHEAALVAAQVARERADAVRQDVGRLERLAAEKQEIEVRRVALVEQVRARAEKVAERDRVTDAVAALDAQVEQGRVQAEALGTQAIALGEKTLAIETAEHPTCDRCAQHLPNEARGAAIASISAELDGVRDRMLVLGQERDARIARKAELQALADAIVIPDAPEGLAELDARHQEIATVVSDLAVARERLATLEHTIAKADTDEYRDEARHLSYELAEAEQALAAIPPLVPGAADTARAAALQAQVKARTHETRARTASERLAAATVLLEQAQTALVEHSAACIQRDEMHAELDILTKLEQAFGRDGVPAWIVESQAIPAIEVEANRVLSALGGAISRVELRTERETKTGEKRDALDVICLTEDGERALETFSGGEQSRAEIALALGLVDVLVARRDADLRFLALDEPAGLDAQGTEALAGILRDRAPGAVVLLASHDANLRDSFDQSVTVEKTPAGSRVVG